MKINSTIKSVLFAAGFSTVAFIGSARAQVVNVDINDSSNPFNGTYSGQGAYSDAGNNFWNALNVGNGATSGGGYITSYTASGLTASNGSTATGISFTLSSQGGSPINAFDTGTTAGVAPALMDDFAYGYLTNGQPNLNFVFSGLVAGNTYNVFLYTVAGSDFTIGSTSLSASNSGPQLSSFVAGGNYVEFTGVVADGSGNISGVDSLASNGVNYFSGAQIVNTTPVVEAPEPSTYALMGLGALALLVVSRRRKA